MKLFVNVLLAVGLQGAISWKPVRSDSRLGEIIFNISDPRCHGFNLIFDRKSYESSLFENELIDYFTHLSSHSFTLLYPNIENQGSSVSNDSYWKFGKKDSRSCTNVVVVNNYFKGEELLLLCKVLLNRFQVYQIEIITEQPLPEAEFWLKEAQNEFFVMIVLKERNINNILTWKINLEVRSFQLLTHTDVKRQDVNLSTGRNMLGRKIRVATLHFPPVVFIKENKHQLEIYGIEPSIMEILADRLNFTLDYFPVSPSEMWGSVTGHGKNLTATGLIGALMKKDVDVALGNLYLDYTRLAIIGFSSHYSIAEECLSVPAPRPYPKWMALYLPFSPEVWAGTLLSIVFSVLTLWLLAKFSFKSRFIDVFYNDLTFCFLTIAGHIFGLQQAQEIRLMANRVFLIWWLFGALILSTGYRSGLISFMTFPYTPPPINTLRQLVDSPVQKIIFDPLMKDILLKSNNSLQRELGHQFITSDNLTFMFSLMDSGEWAVDSNLDNLRYEIANRYPPTSFGPRVHIVRECVFSMRAALGLQLNSPLKLYFDRKIQELIEAGLIQYHRNRFAKKQDPWNPKASKELLPFSLNSQQGAFYAMAFCVAISCLSFMGEFLSYLYQTKQRTAATSDHVC